MELSQEQCEPCRGGVLPMLREEYEPLLAELDGWEVEDERRLKKEYRFRNFREALNWVNVVGEIAEEQNHHPNISFTWGKVGINIWTHKVGGLTKNDFILAAKIDSWNRSVDGA